MEPTKEQKQKFLVRLGLEIVEQTWVEDHYEADGRWYDAVGHLYAGDYLYGLPAIDLNFLWKYAVPKMEAVSLHYEDGFYGAEVLLNNTDYRHSGEDPALALFWACSRALEGE